MKPEYREWTSEVNIHPFDQFIYCFESHGAYISTTERKKGRKKRERKKKKLLSIYCILVFTSYKQVKCRWRPGSDGGWSWTAEEKTQTRKSTETEGKGQLV